MCLFDQVIGYKRHALAEHPIFRKVKLSSCGRHEVKTKCESVTGVELGPCGYKSGVVASEVGKTHRDRIQKTILYK